MGPGMQLRRLAGGPTACQYMVALEQKLRRAPTAGSSSQSIHFRNREALYRIVRASVGEAVVEIARQVQSELLPSRTEAWEPLRLATV
jgi:hypothetical protein